MFRGWGRGIKLLHHLMQSYPVPLYNLKSILIMEISDGDGVSHQPIFVNIAECHVVFSRKMHTINAICGILGSQIDEFCEDVAPRMGLDFCIKWILNPTLF